MRPRCRVTVPLRLRPGVPETLDVFAELNARTLAAPGGIGPGIRAVQRMADFPGRRLVIVEVNFDTLVEDGNEHLFERFTTEETFDGAVRYLDSYLDGTVNRVPLLKVHGTIEDRPSCVASAEQTANGLPRAKTETLMRLSGRPDRRVPWLYVGSSMRDIDLIDVFKRREFAEGVQEYWVAPLLPPTVREFTQSYRPHIWIPGEDVHAHSVTELADEFLRRLAEAWS
jgi:hypothetical protein